MPIIDLQPLTTTFSCSSVALSVLLFCPCTSGVLTALDEQRRKKTDCKNIYTMPILPLFCDLCVPPAVQIFSSLLHAICVRVKVHIKRLAFVLWPVCVHITWHMHLYLACRRGSYLLYFYGHSSNSTNTRQLPPIGMLPSWPQWWSPPLFQLPRLHIRTIKLFAPIYVAIFTHLQ